jgi:1,4-alpha-glucan branching enzyme
VSAYLSLILHAHLPFVRHPEHEKFLEETWLFEAITETYVPLLRIVERWRRDGLAPRLTFTLTPTLCTMLQDPLLQTRYERHLNELIELTDKEIHRTRWQKPLNDLARFYHERFTSVRDAYAACGRDLVRVFRGFQELGLLEIITCAATHSVLPLLVDHPPSLRAQVLVGRDHYRSCFGREPRGIWLPECAYAESVDSVLQEANLRWFVTDTHGILHAQPRPRYGTFAPIFTPKGIAAFGRDPDSTRQVWSRHAGYPGDPRYRDFYRDIGFDLDFDYVKPHLTAPDARSFTGLKYHRITGSSPAKEVYDRQAAMSAADAHASHFLDARMQQFRRLAEVIDRPPILVAPYDAELFGHWWYEGPEFLDLLVRKACSDQKLFKLITPAEFLRTHPTHQVATPAASSWGEGGYWGVWLNEKNEWIYPHLRVAQERMTELARRFPQPAAIQERMLKQAARELLLAQASDWPFILRTGTSPSYARQRVQDHLLRFTRLYEQLMAVQLDEEWLKQVEWRDNIFPDVNYHYWT